MADRRIAFVTGASRGIGKGIAVHLARAGFDVAITARTVEEGESREHSSTAKESDTTPLPGSLSGGLVGTLIALGSPGGAAIAAVLAYRSLAVWLPAVPGVASLASLRTSVASWRMDTASRTPARQFAV